MKTAITMVSALVSKDRLVLDFGDYALMDDAGPQLTDFLQDLESIPDVRTVKAHPHWIEITASPEAPAGRPALALLAYHFGITPAITWLGRRPLRPSPDMPLTHMGL